jgi:hypothetical protein
MAPVVVEIYYAVIMVDTTLIARNRARVQWEGWFDRVMDRPRIEAAPCERSRNSSSPRRGGLRQMSIQC